VFLLTGEQKHAIDSSTSATAGATLLWDTGITPEMDSLLGDDTERFSQWTMWPLAFRRIAGCHRDGDDPHDPENLLKPAIVDDHDLYLMHLVDRRYWWQFVEAPEVCEYTGSWAALIDYLCGQLGISMLFASQDLPLPSGYDSGPHASEWSRNYQNAALLLDAALASIGARLVAGLDQGFEIHRAAGSEAAFQTNLSSNLMGEQLAGSWCNETVTHALPRYVNVAFPKSRFGMLCGQCDESSSSTEQDCHEDYHVITHNLANHLDTGTYCPVQSTAMTIHVRGWADMGLCTDSQPMNNL
jgi:hypothetical protein